MARPIITGCELFDEARGTFVHGDLWEEGECYVFNAVLNGRDAAWTFEAPGENPKVLTIHGYSYQPPFFERRGVIAVAKKFCSLNDEAKEYLRGR